jgi:hypothetical protein
MQACRLWEGMTFPTTPSLRVPGVRGAGRDAGGYYVAEPGDTPTETAVADTLLLVIGVR